MSLASAETKQAEDLGGDEDRIINPGGERIVIDLNYGAAVVRNVDVKPSSPSEIMMQEGVILGNVRDQMKRRIEGYTLLCNPINSGYICRSSQQLIELEGREPLMYKSIFVNFADVADA